MQSRFIKLSRSGNRRIAAKEAAKFPFRIGVAKSRFVKLHVKISKASNPLLMDDCPIIRNFLDMST